MNEPKQTTVNVLSTKNKSRFYLAQHVDCRINDNHIIFHNTLFDSVLLLSLNSEENVAELFVDSLRNGIDNMQEFISSYFSDDWEEIYKVFVQKKIIE